MLPDLSLDDVAAALSALDANDREVWVNMAMAVKSGFGEEGRSVWEEWSRTAGNYDAGAAKSTWKSVRAGGKVGLGSLIYRAKAAGHVFKAAPVSDADRAARKAAQEARRQALEAQAMAEEADRTAWHQRVADACCLLDADHMADTGISEYLGRKRVMAFGLRFLRHGVVVVTDIPGKRIELIHGRDAISAFFERRSAGEIDPETTSFRYLKYGTVAVPMRDAGGVLWAFQFINAQGGKLFLKFARKQGLFHWLTSSEAAEPDEIFAVAEGYVTAASVHEATHWPVAVAFDAGNLGPVAKAMRARHPDAMAIVCGDDDAGAQGNPGRAKASKAARGIGGLAWFPDFGLLDSRAGLTDWNDLVLTVGSDETERQLHAAIDAYSTRSVSGGQVPSGDDDPGADGLPERERPGAYRPQEADWANSLTRDRDRNVQGHVGNLEKIFVNDRRWEGVLGYCDFSYRVLFLQKPPIAHAEPELQDPDVARMRVWFHESYWPMHPPIRSELQDAIVIASQRRRHHPVRAYLEGLKHDGRPRLLHWLRSAFDAAGEAAYLDVVGPKFLIGAVARVMQPGCKMDNMLILEGKQGKGKSSALQVLFGEFFSDAPIPLGDKDAYQLIQGVWGYEMAELDALNKAESTTAKAFMSQQTDRFRPPYGTGVMTFKRQTVFIGTTNQDEYLKDYSGNRRYWPALCRHVDLEWLKVNRDQLWAEALVAYRAGESWWIDDEAERILCEAEQDTRLARDAWEDIIRDWLALNRQPFFTAAEILTQALQLDAAHIQRVHQNRLSPIMKALGWGKGRRDKGGKRVNVYTRPEGEMVNEPTLVDAW